MRRKHSRPIAVIAGIIIATNIFYLAIHIAKHPLIYRSRFVNAIAPLSALCPFGNYLVPLFALFVGIQLLLLRKTWRTVFIIYQAVTWAVSIFMCFFGSAFAIEHLGTLRTVVHALLPTIMIFSTLPAFYIYFLSRHTVKKQFR